MFLVPIFQVKICCFRNFQTFTAIPALFIYKNVKNNTYQQPVFSQTTYFSQTKQPYLVKLLPQYQPYP